LGISDEELVSVARAGKVGAFDELMSRHQEKVFALAYRIMGNAEDAADVQQEAFVRAWGSLSRFRGESAFGTWIHRITVNLCLSRKRRKSAAVPAEGLDEDQLYQFGSHGVDCQDSAVDALAVRQLLSTIPPNQRTLLILRDVEGRSIDEIAQIVGGSAGAIRKNLWRARKLFREKAKPLFEEQVK
jgi:RNA polymerase sigma-70 factor (ECF subfamily)